MKNINMQVNLNPVIKNSPVLLAPSPDEERVGLPAAGMVRSSLKANPRSIS
ncbi:MAG: hypothetical protein HOB17_09585 [Candidatus Marinimicrobia bacterium]|nr:hypothetical protein [Candidatus Neomarinimicrobiota bacterium]MBT3895673.1 hypothetical protein [Candidatus Neomarinimicrobiota bacterium]MBT4173288.1 hypothetical protein [Candidatus Neomarinimicrobiota bacterium]MBT4537778.1 hypothetical protein [Candidatus Neomarinimicrobiota bacterium]MBT4852189.1 hypothetical protein [Candidatus Neomarinimicrobiota bacterium]